MATSRTGTATWKRVRAQAIKKAKASGLTHCRYCNTLLNYEVGRTPSSAEVDHLVPHSKGGQDRLDNVEVICRLCNQSKGHRATPKKREPDVGFRVSREW